MGKNSPPSQLFVLAFVLGIIITILGLSYSPALQRPGGELATVRWPPGHLSHVSLTWPKGSITATWPANHAPSNSVKWPPAHILPASPVQPPCDGAGCHDGKTSYVFPTSHILPWSPTTPSD